MSTTGTGASDTTNAAVLDGHIRRLTAHGPRHADNPRAVAATLGYLTDQLTGYGYRVEAERYGTEPHQVNLLAERQATGNAPMLELGAHWDSVPEGPGADDNASGVAGLLEIARVLAAAPTPACPLRFCLFAEEEDASTGYLGSRAHVARLDADPAGTRVEGVIVLEMIGYRDRRPGSQRLPEDVVPPGADRSGLDRGDFIAAIGNAEAGPYLDALHAAGTAQDPHLPVVPIVLPADHATNGARSDHRPYWTSGRAGVMVTDTANFRNPHYHLASDTVDTLDLAFAAAVTAAVCTAVRTLCW